jgi:prepilin-type N-terminal cleavage/methylation domain-containing protein
MSNKLSGKGGFTLVELLVVTAILGLVLGAIYSIYLTHMRTAYTQDEVVEVQQNLRIALDAISRDLKMAGALVPYGTPAIDPASTATNLIINTGAPTDAVARIVTTLDSTATGTFAPTVESVDSMNNFSVGDTVRIIRPFDGSQPFDTTTMNSNLYVSAKDTTAKTITLKKSNGTSFALGITINNGDIISKISAAAAARFDTITYSVGNCPVGSGLSESCLYRSVNGGAGDVIASNLATSASVPPGLSFAFLTEDIYGTSAISAAQLTLTGVTRKKASLTDIAKNRQLISIVKLRNRRSF